MYWRLLSADPEAAKAIVLSADKPLVSDSSNLLDTDLLDVLISQIGTVSSVFHQPPASFIASQTSKMQAIARARIGHDLDDEDVDDAVKDDGDNDDQGTSSTDTAPAPQQGSSKSSSVDLLDLDFGDTTPAPAPAKTAPTSSPSVSSSLDDILGLSMSSSSVQQSTPSPAPAPVMQSSSPQGMGTGLDLFAQPAAEPAVQKVMLLTAEKGAGMEILGAFSKASGGLTMELTCNNRGSVPLGDFVMQFNKNAYGLTPAESPQFGVVQPGMSANATVHILRQEGMIGQNGPANQIQIAVKNSTGRIFFFAADIPAGFF